MNRLPRVTGQEVVRALSRGGFQIARRRGSHWILKHHDGRMTVVPVHEGDVIGPGLMTKILREADLTREEFSQLLAR